VIFTGTKVLLRLFSSLLFHSNPFSLSVSSGNLDIIGIYAASSEAFFSLEKPPTFLPFVPTTKETHAKGVLLLELSHALALLASGNHRLMEIFFISNSSSQQSNHIGYESTQWKQLKENQELRKQILSKPAFHHYVGIAQGILGNCSNLITSATSTPTSLSETAKNLSLAKLFLESARRISEGQEPMVELDEESRGIRREQPTEGEVPKYREELVKLFQELHKKFEEVLKVRKSKEALTKIPDSPKAPLNDWLVQTRKELHWWNKQQGK
jgi:hypothetical protein